MINTDRGSMWHRWDLHFHTPSSFDYEDNSISNQDIVDALVEAEICVVAITDHHTIDVDRIRKLQVLGKDKLTVLPGLELRTDQGRDPIHYICIFPEDCDLDHVWTTLQGGLGLTPKDIAKKGGDEQIYVPIVDSAPKARELGGVVSIHAGAKSNSIEEIKNEEKFQQRIKYDITNQHVDLLEIGQIKDIERHLEIIFPNTGLERPLVLCSDNHKASEYYIKAPTWLRADPTFRGLLMAIREPRQRVFIGEEPPQLNRVKQNTTKYIDEISFSRKESGSKDEVWFTGNIPFNPGLVAIIGNKGSGKSALSDTIGLLGATKNASEFSFLSPERFRHPNSNLAHLFNATLKWMSGESVTKCLEDSINPEEVERVKYLPQDHVESVCNELIGIGENTFEKELKGVIFSHVPEAARLNLQTLDELVNFRTNEKQRRIDSLINQLREVSRTRSALELKADPTEKKTLEEKIKRRQGELKAHEQAKPEEVEDPIAKDKPEEKDEGVLLEITKAEKQKADLDNKITKARSDLKAAERRLAVANVLGEKLDNIKKEFATFKLSLEESATELGLETDDLLTLHIESAKVSEIREEAEEKVNEIGMLLGTKKHPGLLKQSEDVAAAIAELQSKLDAPARAYKAYLKVLEKWEEKRAEIEGSEDEPDSLKGLQNAISQHDDLPEQIQQKKEEQQKLALDILEEKLAQASIYRDLYKPVQAFIDSHEIAKDKFKLEFRAELMDDGFSERFLSLLAQNRKGSFMGIEEGKAKTETLVQITNWELEESVKKFLLSVDEALHIDQRDGQGGAVLLKDQVAGKRRPEEVFDLLYGLEYIRPRYILRWEGKDLSMLSPGERGTLLLVFYLLIDKSDIPLIIDQPEGNLDNHTVAKVLVECIREARNRRQVFIVTHNPNLAVVCDADQVVHADINKSEGNRITYDIGSLENPVITRYVTDVLEGTMGAFTVRGRKYEVGQDVTT